MTLHCNYIIHPFLPHLDFLHSCLRFRFPSRIHSPVQYVSPPVTRKGCYAAVLHPEGRRRSPLLTFRFQTGPKMFPGLRREASALLPVVDICEYQVSALPYHRKAHGLGHLAPRLFSQRFVFTCECVCARPYRWVRKDRVIYALRLRREREGAIKLNLFTCCTFLPSVPSAGLGIPAIPPYQNLTWEGTDSLSFFPSG